MNNKSLLAFYKQHVEEVLLPFWNKALDHKNGGIYTCFNNTGDQLVSKAKYTWSQGRFLWLWAEIARMISEGKLKGEVEKYINHLDKSAKFLEENVFLKNGNCAFLLTETGEKKESILGKGYDTSLYADCFVVLGLAKYADLIKDERRFEKALELYFRIRERITIGEIRTEPYPIPEGFRAHSISMIMLNVVQELAEVAGALGHQKKDELYQHSISYMKDIMDNFYRKDHRVVEMVPDDKLADKDTLLYRHVNPGHTIESMWFVIHTAQKIGPSEYIWKAAKAIEQAINKGWDSDNGGLYRFVDINGGKPKGREISTPYEQLILDSWDMKLWWPHSEALYATLLSYVLSGDTAMMSTYDKVQDYVFKTFPNPDEQVGEWIQIRNREGKPIDKVAALPVKDPFHILRDILLIIELLEKDLEEDIC